MEGVGRAMDQEAGYNGCKLLYIKSINNKVLYNTENYLHYPMINHNEKNIKKEYICTHKYIHVYTYMCM